MEDLRGMILTARRDNGREYWMMSTSDRIVLDKFRDPK